VKVANGEQAALFKENEDLYKRMNKSIERKIAGRDLEIKNIDQVYDKKIEAAKNEGEKEYLQSLDRNQQLIIGESNNFEEKIKNYQEQLAKTRETVVREEAALKGGHKEKINLAKKELEENFQSEYFDMQADREQIQSSTRDAVKEISTNSKSAKLKMEDNAQFEINALSSEFNQKATDSESAFRAKLEQDVRMHNAEISQQKEDLKKLMTLDGEKNKRLGTEKNRVNKEQLDYQDKHQQDVLAQKEKDFKVRYENIVKNYNSVLKELSDKLEADVKKVVEKTTNDKKIIEERSSDHFYNVDRLNPKITEDEKTVTVSIPVTAYEKENMHLSTQGRSIKLTLTRKYNDTLNDEDGSINRSTRSELYSKELSTKDLLSPNNVTQAYVDGVLSFKIHKA
jgi:hypothetical protein